MKDKLNDKKSLAGTIGIALIAATSLAACGHASDKNNNPISPTVTSTTSGVVGNNKSATPTTTPPTKTTTPTSNTPKVKELKTYHTDSSYTPPTAKKNSPTSSTNGNNNNSSTNTTNNSNDLYSNGSDTTARVGSNGKIYSPSNTRNEYTPKSSGNAQGYPVSISVPKMGLYHSIASYGTRGGILDPYPNSVQYYTGSVLPGKTGNSVIASHVTYNGVARAFYYLNQLNSGDRFTITYSNGAKKTFQVYNKESVNKYKLRYDQRVWGSSNTANVVLLSCDKNSGWMPGHMHRTNNYVVWAKLV